MKYYKILDKNREPYHGGSEQWPYRKWHTVDGDLEPCKNGLHILRAKNVLIDWGGPVLWEVEIRGEKIELSDKIVAREAKLIGIVKSWNERNLRLLACDFAERVLDNFEKKHPGNDRPRKAIEVARKYANGEATLNEIEAAYSAADIAAWAAYSAAWAADSAAYRAAYSAADIAAYSAADIAYSAAWAAWAAYRAAYRAKWAAYSAAYRAAYWAADSADSAAHSAADIAEKEWQIKRIKEVLGI